MQWGQWHEGSPANLPLANMDGKKSAQVLIVPE